jgi:arylsulfatase A
MFRLSIATLLLISATCTLAAGEKPNVVVIFTDDQGYADVGCFGAKGYSTPNLDRMAKEGTRFTNFHVAQAVCSASRAALLTGCYPNRIGFSGALNNTAKHGLHSDETTFAEVVKPLGYATAMFGKWHLGHHPQFLPTQHGFDEYLGLPYSNDMWPPNGARYPDLPLIEGDKTKQVITEQSQLTTWYTERAVKFIDTNKDKPFLLYVAHSMPHVPLYVSDKFKGKSEKGLYGDVIMEIDWSVGEILNALKKNGVDEKTLVIFTSDNGPWMSYGEHAGSAHPLREGKGTSWEGGVRVPCIMRWPGKIPADKECRETLMTIDVLPTIAHITGGELPKTKIDGMNVWPIIAGEAGAKNPHDAYFVYYNVNDLQAVISGKWKLYLPHSYRTLAGKPGGKDGKQAQYVMTKVETPELYDLENDVSETINVAEKNKEVLDRLLALADQCREELGDNLTKRTGKNVRAPGRLAETK